MTRSGVPVFRFASGLEVHRVLDQAWILERCAAHGITLPTDEPPFNMGWSSYLRTYQYANGLFCLVDAGGRPLRFLSIDTEIDTEIVNLHPILPGGHDPQQTLDAFRWFMFDSFLEPQMLYELWFVLCEFLPFRQDATGSIVRPDWAAANFVKLQQDLGERLGPEFLLHDDDRQIRRDLSLAMPWVLSMDHFLDWLGSLSDVATPSDNVVA